MVLCYNSFLSCSLNIFIIMKRNSFTNPSSSSFCGLHAASPPAFWAWWRFCRHQWHKSHSGSSHWGLETYNNFGLLNAEEQRGWTALYILGERDETVLFTMTKSNVYTFNILFNVAINCTWYRSGRWPLRMLLMSSMSSPAPVLSSSPMVSHKMIGRGFPCRPAFKE